MQFETIMFPHILQTDELVGLNHFLSHTAFIVCHKNEPVETLLSVLWYLPANSPIILVTNCPQTEFAEIKESLAERLMDHTRIYLVHQKDHALAQFFYDCGVKEILGEDELVVDGKGEGMYIGAACASLLGYPQWLLFFDADNFVPSALLEYTLALGRLFQTSQTPLSSLPTTGELLDSLPVTEDLLTTLPITGDLLTSLPTTQELLAGVQLPPERQRPESLHNVRICWASKPDLSKKTFNEKVLGRCTRVISPLINTLLADSFGLHDEGVAISNAGEQGMTMQTARTLRFSSGYSVETFQLLDFFARAESPNIESALLQQYQARSPHFHQKKEDGHIKKMIAASLGCFFHFPQFLTEKLSAQIKQIEEDLALLRQPPTIYPALESLPTNVDATFLHRCNLLYGVPADVEYSVAVL